MASNYYAAKCVSLVDAAQRIFGDIVKDAYFVQEFYGSACEDSADIVLCTAEHFDASDDIQLDNQEVVIVFTNGRKVNFNASDWASISEFNKEPLFVS